MTVDKDLVKVTVPRVDVFYSMQSDYCYFLLDRLISQAEHIELEKDEGFFDYFIDGCMFTPGPKYDE